MAKRTKRTGKGKFGELGLPVSPRYLFPENRRKLLLAGVVLAALVVAVFLVDSLRERPTLLSNGPLSSSHANLEAECSACHTPLEDVADASCSTCHEKYGDELGSYTWNAHYLYRSGDFTRLVSSPDEMSCATCHVEHEGREAEITRVADAQCVVCHEYGSFNRDHPQFDFVGEKDDETLSFQHTHHVAEVMERNEIEDLERACLTCHEPRADGSSFEPIRFDRHCDSCHLTTGVRTPALPVAAADTPGVASLETIQASGRPGTRWSFFLNPRELRQAGGRVVKSPVYHRDPWVLDNLRSLRNLLYPDAGLADLLIATPEIEEHRLVELYKEAIDTLDEQAEGLRSRPEPAVQRDLTRIEDLLKLLRRRLEDPFVALDETEFVLALGERDPEVSDERQAAIASVIQDLTEPCRECHQIDRATIARVSADQRTLRRAEFDHRSHVVQRRCLDCHDTIPVDQLMAADEPPAAEVDSAGVHNLPQVEACQECHNPKVASNRCVTCHLFHPDRERHADLLLYEKP